MVIVALTILATALPVASLTVRQERKLATILVCPERLPGDAARIANTDAFMMLYARYAPRAKAGERMELRNRILLAKKCRDLHPLQHTYPET